VYNESTPEEHNVSRLVPNPNPELIQHQISSRELPNSGHRRPSRCLVFTVTVGFYLQVVKECETLVEEEGMVLQDETNQSRTMR
jgi:hypothetical protein